MKRLTPLLLLLFATALMIGAMPYVSFAAQEQATTTAQPATNVSSSTAKAPQGIININTATAAELAKLPGVGPKTAEAIIAEREKSGGFKSTDDLMKIKGIGPKKFDKIKDMISI